MTRRPTGLFRRRPPALITSLEDHPHADGVLAVLGGLSEIQDAHLPRLAGLWTNDVEIAAARALALSADAPLVVEVLAAFEAIDALFEDDLRGEADYVRIDPEITRTALKAVRDAVAAAYAQPVLSRRQHGLLMRPWRTVLGSITTPQPDLGPRGTVVRDLLAALPCVVGRCHDEAAAAAYDDLVTASFLDVQDRREAADTAFRAAVDTERRRTWTLVRRSAAEVIQRPCGLCGRRDPDPDLARVHAAVADAACALLVADALPSSVVSVLTAPVGVLIPAQRRSSATGPGEQLLG